MTEKDPLNKQDEGASARRSWLLGAVAGAAALSGASVAWWVYSPREVATSAEEALWLLDFALPKEGPPLDMARFRGRPLLLNFWATWCPPCVEELPLLSRFYSENAAKGWQVLGLAVDQATPVNRFLAKTPVTFPVALAGVPGIEIGKLLGNQRGGLPFTVVLGSDGKVAHRKIGQVSPEDLGRWAALT
ncbi:MAG: TlpA family protein disulfide reductase [Rhodoferax sp.]|nr:TlpA family protein disulfide reductase [Rhodoferax sp.]MBP7491158.1 TlpA family protein disulfide reductase [Rhodoferax sp.]